MKIRQGFVSNSSTSSFVIMCSKKIYELALEKCSEFGRAVIKHELPLRNEYKYELDGNEYYMWHGEKSSEEWGYDIPYPKKKTEVEPEEDSEWRSFKEEEEGIDEEEKCEEAMEEWEKFGNRITKLGGIFDECM